MALWQGSQHMDIIAGCSEKQKERLNRLELNYLGGNSVSTVREFGIPERTEEDDTSAKRLEAWLEARGATISQVVSALADVSCNIAYYSKGVDRGYRLTFFGRVLSPDFFCISTQASLQPG